MDENVDKVVKSGDVGSGNETPYAGHPALPPQMAGQAMPQQLDPKAEAINEAVRQLIDAATKLTVKVATCSCEKKDECGVFKFGREVAKAIDSLQTLA